MFTPVPPNPSQAAAIQAKEQRYALSQKSLPSEVKELIYLYLENVISEIDSASIVAKKNSDLFETSSGNSRAIINELVSRNYDGVFHCSNNQIVGHILFEKHNDHFGVFHIVNNSVTPLALASMFRDFFIFAKDSPGIRRLLLGPHGNEQLTRVFKALKNHEIRYGITVEEQADKIEVNLYADPIISPLAAVSPLATIGRGTRVGAYAIIGPHVTLGEYCVIEPHAVLQNNITLGAKNRVGSFAVLGGAPQIRRESYPDGHLIIGDNNEFREHTTAHVGARSLTQSTTIGNHNLFMVGVHVAHDVVIGDSNTFVNGVMLAGHVEVGDKVTISGGCKVQQHVRIGTLAFIGGDSRVTSDIPPYCFASGGATHGARLLGINQIGLERNGQSKESINNLKTYYRRAVLNGRLDNDTSESPEVNLMREALKNPGRHGVAPNHRGKAVSNVLQTPNEQPKTILHNNVAARLERYVPELVAKLQANLQSGHCISGADVFELEDKIKSYTGANHCISCSSGTSGLQLALMAYGIGHGDGVIVPSFTFAASANVISLVGATPIFADINSTDLNLSATAIREAIQKSKSYSNPPNIKAIIAVNIFGAPCDYDEIRKICEEEKIILIEDACQSFGATYKGKKSGTLGDVSVFSFYPTKPLGGIGDGGAITCHDDEIARRIIAMRNHGRSANHDSFELIGMNSRLDPLKAYAVTLALNDLGEDQEKRAQLALIYQQNLPKILGTQGMPLNSANAYAQFPIILPQNSQGGLREHVISTLRNGSFEIREFYTTPLHLQESFSNLGYNRGDLPTTEDICSRVIYLPIDPYSITFEQQDRVINIISSVLS